jgi:hypothetical protein
MRELMMVARPGYGGALREEVVRRYGPAAPLQAGEPDVVRLVGDAVPKAWREGRNALVLAAQWLADPFFEPVSAGVSTAMIDGLSVLAGGSVPWTLHAFGSGGEGSGHTHQAGRLGDALLAACAEKAPDLYQRYIPPRRAGADAKVFQLCLTARGAWWSLMQARDLLDLFPGGEHRMPFDAAAPSRSYLKVEEAFDVMGCAPRKGDRVVDLGASPGGWSYAFLKRGCEVLAVDRGPMKIPERHPSGGRLRHLLVDGVGFRLPREWERADWLACDMLVPPGKTQGLLKRWLEEGNIRRFIVNFKIPQEHPDSVLEPIEAMLQEFPRLRYRLRQLYHDRREVTCMGEAPFSRT